MHARPAIFNTGRVSPFISLRFNQILFGAPLKVSMEGGPLDGQHRDQKAIAKREGRVRPPPEF
ncbi:hypothetical protein DL237_19225 [Pseudooceanicola sediminis]|uniref:Uncharacterized protein n=1 Tax=Pseudooceanicola sediminis TaxID=2211117 RepID=A0A399IVK9_9RHOB|nr:hypothetical protein DL237_19225 [Pseudooceanicola sediminis]